MKIRRINIPQHTEAWYQFRKENGYGASEIASVLSEYSKNLQDYLRKSPLQVYLEKIGENVTRFSGNLYSEAGHYMEEHIIKLYRYWDNKLADHMVMYDNLKNNNVQNIVRRCSFFMTNSEYPFLFFSPDALEYNDAGKPIGIIECKNTKAMEANRYPLGVSPSFLCQVAQGLLVSNLEYARILIWIDGSELRVETVYRDDPSMQAIMKTILLDGVRSWEKVLKARIIKEEHGIEYYYQYPVDHMTSLQQKGISILQPMEPEFTGSEYEYDWIKEQIHPHEESVVMQGTQDQWDWCIRRQELLAEKSKIEDEERLLKTKMIASLMTDVPIEGEFDEEGNQVFNRIQFNTAEFKEQSILQGDDYIPEPALEKAYFSHKADRNGRWRLHVSKDVKPYTWD